MRLGKAVTAAVILSVFILTLLPFLNGYLHTLRERKRDDAKLEARAEEAVEAFSKLKATSTLFDQFVEERDKRRKERLAEYTRALLARTKDLDVSKDEHADLRNLESPASRETPITPPTADLKADGQLQKYLDVHNGAYPILVVCHNRAAELGVTLDALLALPKVERETLLVIQDGSDPMVKQKVMDKRLPYVQNLRLEQIGMRESGSRIAEHYLFALEKAFEHFKDAPAIIIMEDDLQPSPDFMEWFAAGSLVLESDPSVWCVSAWNDNGFQGLVKNSFGIRRTMLFPGLGWLLTRNEFEKSLRPGWPKDNWDWYVRGIYQKLDRECIHPEIPRTFHIGRTGTFVNEKDQKAIFDRMARNEKTNLNWKGSEAMESLRGAIRSQYDFKIDLLLNEPSTLHVRDITQFRELVRLETCTGKAVVLWYIADPDPKWETGIMSFTRFFGIWHQLLRGSHEGMHDIYHKDCRVLLINVFEPRLAAHSIWFTGYSHQSRYAQFKPRDVPAFQPQELAMLSQGFEPPKDIRVASYFGVSCTITCNTSGLECDQAALGALNTCAAVRRHLPCASCEVSQGPDQPCIVSPDAPAGNFPNQCLITSSLEFNCDGQHPLTKRLCACKPRIP